MNIKDILNGAAAVAGIAFPPVGLAIKAVNAFLPDDKKLPETATGADVNNAITGLPPETQALIYEQDIKLEITESNNFKDNFAAAVDADKSGNSTRPQIAMMMASIVSFAVVLIASGFFVALYTSDTEMMKEITESWPFVVALLGTPTMLLRAYFGMRTKEKQSRYAVSAGHAPSTGIIERFLR